MAPVADQQGKIVDRQDIRLTPTTAGSTSGAFSLYYKCKVSHHGPAGLICQTVHWIDINAPLPARFPPWDKLNKDPLKVIKDGDWVEINAPEVGETATVTITRK
jgi:predicted aconitase with swiveling domain